MDDYGNSIQAPALKYRNAVLQALAHACYTGHYVDAIDIGWRRESWDIAGSTLQFSDALIYCVFDFGY